MGGWGRGVRGPFEVGEWVGGLCGVEVLGFISLFVFFFFSVLFIFV